MENRAVSYSAVPLAWLPTISSYQPISCGRESISDGWEVLAALHDVRKDTPPTPERKRDVLPSWLRNMWSVGSY
jgi:hypothetical protein